MNIELKISPVDDQITGFELGDITLQHEGVRISSAGYNPSRSMMIFIFLSDLLDLLRKIRTEDKQTEHVITATDSSFMLKLKKSGKDLSISEKKSKMSVPLDTFLSALYSAIHDCLTTLNPIDPNDAALTDLLNSLEHLRHDLEKGKMQKHSRLP